jgi:3-oxoadipate enol-lactonase
MAETELPALLLVHGFPLDARMWTAQVEGLGDIRRVLAPDLPGHGVDTDGPQRSVDGMAKDLARVLDAAGVQQVDLAGFSMGGYVCFAFLKHFPDRVRSLALVDTRASADSDEGKQGRNKLAKRIQEEGSLAAAEAMLPKMFTESVNQDVRAQVASWMLESRPETLIADVIAMRDRPDATPRLGEIKVPTLVIVGEADPITPPSDAEAMAAAIPGARVVVIPGASHLAPVEQGQAVNDALRDHLST